MRYSEEKEVLRGKDIDSDSYEQVVVRRCDYCGINNIVIKQIWNKRDGYEMHSYPSKREYLAGKKTVGGILCDSCASISGKICQVKDLESEIKHYRSMLKEVCETVENLHNAVREDKE